MPFLEYQPGHSPNADNHTCDHYGSTQPAYVGLDKTEHETSQSNCGKRSAQPIHRPLRFVTGAFGYSSPDNQQHDGAERNVDEKNPSPRESFDEPAAKNRTD